MRRLPLYVLTAVTALTMTAGMTMTSQAASKVIVIGGNSGGFNISGDCLPGNSQGMIPSYPVWNPSLPDNGFCQLPDFNNPILPDINNPILPDINNPSLPDTDVTPPQEDSSNQSFTRQVENLVNAERAKAGLAPLKVSSNVTAAAQVRAGEIERSFSHTRPDGSNFSTALTQNGVQYMGSGENIAYGQRSPQDVMNTWMNSAGHRANILNEKYTTMGIGYYQNGSGTGYWVQLFTY